MRARINLSPHRGRLSAPCGLPFGAAIRPSPPRRSPRAGPDALTEADGGQVPAAVAAGGEGQTQRPPPAPAVLERPRQNGGGTTGTPPPSSTGQNGGGGAQSEGAESGASLRPLLLGGQR